MGIGSWFRGLVGGRRDKPGERDVADGDRDVPDGDRDVPDGERDVRDGERDVRDGERDVRDGGPESRTDGAPYRSAPEPIEHTPAPERLPDGLATRFPPKGPMQSATTSRAVRVQGVPCTAGSQLTFHANGRLYTAHLAIDWTCDGVALPAGAIVGFRRDGTLQTWYATLADARTVCGVELPAGTQVSVYDDRFETLTLCAPLTLAGHTFPAETALGFNDDGKLSSATAGEVVVIGDIPCAAHETIRFNDDGTLSEAWLAEDRVIDGVPCQGHEIVRFHDNGKLGRCYVSREFELDGVPCAEGTRIYLSEKGRLLDGTPSRDIVIDGVPCPADRDLALDGEGRLVLAYPPRNFEHRGIPCKGPSRVELVDGALVRVDLASEHTFHAITLPADTAVFLDGDRARVFTVPTPIELFGRSHPAHTLFEVDATGALLRTLPVAPSFGMSVHASFRVKTCVLGRDVEVDGIPCRGQSTLGFYDDGTLEELALARDAIVADLPCRGVTSVRFYPSGKPHQLTLDKDCDVEGVPCKGATSSDTAINDIKIYKEYVRFDPSGALNFATLSRRYEHAGIPLAANHSIVFHPDRTLNVATLAADARVEDVELRAHTLIAFHPNGRLRSGTRTNRTAFERSETGETRHDEPAQWALDVTDL